MSIASYIDVIIHCLSSIEDLASCAISDNETQSTGIDDIISDLNKAKNKVKSINSLSYHQESIKFLNHLIEAFEVEIFEACSQNELPEVQCYSRDSERENSTSEILVSYSNAEITLTEPDDRQRCLIDNQGVVRQMAIEDTIQDPSLVGGFENIAGLTEAKQALHEAIIMPLKFPHLFTGKRKPWQRILLYGPPGTGKSRLAQGLASEIQSTFYCLSSSDLLSHLFGESEKLIRDLFSHATGQASRSVIFFDEIDSLCRKRSATEEEATRRIKTELLKQMDDGSSVNSNFFLLCATNCPWDLDTAFLRRFQKRIYIPLPDKGARLKMLRLYAADTDTCLSDSDWLHLAERTEGFSGSDVNSLVKCALYEPIRELQQAQRWKHTSDGKWMPCERSELGLSVKLSNLPPQMVYPRAATMEHFHRAVSVTQSTVSLSELTRFEEFTRCYGQSGR